MPPLNKCVTLGPLNPDKVCRDIADAVGYDVAVIDANDLGIEILGFSGKKNQIDFLTKVLADNPLCQGNQCTPMGIIRKAR
ncbi:MAG: F420-0--gamma-glutamyl ligase, partial [Peptococcaceae bacterium]|nr:F420-0--gamma-glutamyl ligase [Peptococcaceae bacterium]